MPPRIRSLKPEAMQHVRVGSLSHFAFRLWVGCVTHADDDGRIVADARQFRVQFFGYHPRVTVARVETALEEMASARLVTLYTVDGLRCLHFPGWRAHQRIHKHHYTASRLPAPPVPIPDESRTRTAGSEWIGSERNGMDRIGGEGSRGEGIRGAPARAPQTPLGLSQRIGPPATYEQLLEQTKAKHPELSEAEVKALIAREPH